MIGVIDECETIVLGKIRAILFRDRLRITIADGANTSTMSIDLFPQDALAFAQSIVDLLSQNGENNET